MKREAPMSGLACFGPRLHGRVRVRGVRTSAGHSRVLRPTNSRARRACVRPHLQPTVHHGVCSSGALVLLGEHVRTVPATSSLMSTCSPQRVSSFGAIVLMDICRKPSLSPYFLAHWSPNTYIERGSGRVTAWAL